MAGQFCCGVPRSHVPILVVRLIVDVGVVSRGDLRLQYGLFLRAPRLRLYQCHPFLVHLSAALHPSTREDAVPVSFSLGGILPDTPLAGLWPFLPKSVQHLVEPPRKSMPRPLEHVVSVAANLTLVLHLPRARHLCCSFARRGAKDPVSLPPGLPTAQAPWRA